MMRILEKLIKPIELEIVEMKTIGIKIKWLRLIKMLSIFMKIDITNINIET